MTGVIITHHAVERFVQRHAPYMTVPEARDYLEEASESAARLKERTVLGQAQWRIDDPPCVLVVKHDPRVGPVVVTVLPDAERFRDVGPDEDDWQPAREMIARLPPASPPGDVDPAKVARKAPARAYQAPPPARDSDGRALQRAMMAHAKERDEEKTRRHNLEQQLLIARLKRTMRIAARALLRQAVAGDEEARAALEAIQQEEPGYLTEAFLVGKLPKAAE